MVGAWHSVFGIRRNVVTPIRKKFNFDGKSVDGLLSQQSSVGSLKAAIRQLCDAPRYYDAYRSITYLKSKIQIMEKFQHCTFHPTASNLTNKLSYFFAPLRRHVYSVNTSYKNIFFAPLRRGTSPGIKTRGRIRYAREKKQLFLSNCFLPHVNQCFPLAHRFGGSAAPKVQG